MPPAPVNTPMFWENLSTMFLVSASAIGGIYLMTTDTRPMVVAAQTKAKSTQQSQEKPGNKLKKTMTSGEMSVFSSEEGGAGGFEPNRQ